MRLITFIVSSAVVLSGCMVVKNPRTTTTYLRQPGGEEQLMQADRDFADAAHARGLEGWMSFFANDAVRIKYRGGMVKGYDAVRAGDASLFADTTVVLNWQPLEAHVFQRGGVGITIGTSQVVKRFGPDAGKVTYRGRYTTVWRRDANGVWKVIMDTGYPDAPAP